MQADAEGPQVGRPARVQLGAGLVIAAHLRREEGGRARSGLDVVLVPSTRLDVGDSEVGELGDLPAERGGGGGMAAAGWRRRRRRDGGGGGGGRVSACWGLERQC